MAEGYPNNVYAVHMIGVAILLEMTMAAFYITKSNEKIEPYYRRIMLINMTVIAFVYGGVSTCKIFDILLSGGDLTYDDFDPIYFFLFVITHLLLIVHQTMNVVRIFYEYQRSLNYVINQSFPTSFVILNIYFLIAVCCQYDPIIMLISIIVMDYIQHMTQWLIYLNRLCCNKDGYYKRNLWGVIGGAAHMAAGGPLLIYLLLPDSAQKEWVLVLFTAFVYWLGIINFFGWFTVFSETPREFVTDGGNGPKVEFTDVAQVSSDITNEDNQ